MNSYERINFVDYGRSFAIIAMIIYHFAYDLGQFGFIDLQVIISGPWKFFATIIGSSFLFISGFSFWIMISRKFNLIKFLKRLLVLIFSSLIISIVTYIYLGNSFIFFGILHLLALCTIIGLVIFRIPFLILIIISIFIFFTPYIFKSDFFEPKYLSWIGLYGKSTGSVDFYPFFPWSSSFILGIAISKILFKRKILISEKASFKKDNIAFINRCLLWSGRNSLLIYLLHQPILIGLIFLYTFVN